MKIIPLYPAFNEANCYIAIADGQCECAVLDPGDNAQRIFNKAESNGLKIKKIILTHAHFDHIMAVNELVSLTGAEIIIHKDDLQALYEPSLNLSTLGTGESYVVNSGLNVTAISDGDIINLGNEYFTVISTPGHTPGSACFMCGDVIFTGDTLFGSSIGRTDFPGGSTEHIKKSITKLRELSGDYTLYPGHGGETTLSRERQHNYFLSSEFTDQ